MHRTDKYSQHNSTVWPLWLNDWLVGTIVLEITVNHDGSRCRSCHAGFKHKEIIALLESCHRKKVSLRTLHRLLWQQNLYRKGTQIMKYKIHKLLNSIKGDTKLLFLLLLLFVCLFFFFTCPFVLCSLMSSVPFLSD